MPAALLPPNENERLAAVRRYRLIDRPAEEAFQRVTELAARAIGVPIVIASLVDEHHQFLAGCVGIDVRQTTREVSFCAHAILSERPFVVADARKDPRFADNALVTGDPHIRSYAGIPLIAPDGHRLGALAAIDTQPRQFKGDDLLVLTELAQVIVDQLELRLARALVEERNAELAEQTRILLAILDSVGEGIAVLDKEGRFVFFNPAAEHILGYGANDDEKRRWVREQGIYRVDRTTPIPLSELPLSRALEGETVSRFEMYARRPDRENGTFISTSAAPLVDENSQVTGVVATFADVTEMRLTHERLAALATTDALTGIANHRAFRERLDLLVADGKRGRRFGLVFIDVDHFKRFNDEHGHQTGDRVLAAVAQRIAHRVRKNDLAARYGGEEFAVLLTDLHLPDALSIAEQLRAAVEGLQLDHPVTASFGVAMFSPEMSAEQLIERADTGVYAAKRAGRNCVRAGTVSAPT